MALVLAIRARSASSSTPKRRTSASLVTRCNTVPCPWQGAITRDGPTKKIKAPSFTPSASGNGQELIFKRATFLMDSPCLFGPSHFHPSHRTPSGVCPSSIEVRVEEVTVVKRGRSDGEMTKGTLDMMVLRTLATGDPTGTLSPK